MTEVGGGGGKQNPRLSVCHLISSREIKWHTEREKVVSRKENNGLGRSSGTPSRWRRSSRWRVRSSRFRQAGRSWKVTAGTLAVTLRV
jgi:hypothetical protein